MMEALIERIKQEAVLLYYTKDSIALDKQLGEIECLIHSARQEIDDEWRATRNKLREVYPRRSEPKLSADDLFKELEL